MAIRSTTFALAGVAALGLAALAAPGAAQAAPLTCGTLVTHAQAFALDPSQGQGAAPAQALDANPHPLPWSNDLTEQSGGSSAHENVQATCEGGPNSISVHIAGSEWGTAAPNVANAHARVGWSPTWSTAVVLPPRKQLVISVASNVNYLSCQLVAPGVAMNWSGSYSNSMTTADGVTSFVATLNCTSSGQHEIVRNSFSGWVNGESVLIDLTLIDPSRPGL